MAEFEELYLEYIRKKQQVFMFVADEVFSRHQAADILELLAVEYGYKLKEIEISVIEGWRRKSTLIYEVVNKQSVKVYQHYPHNGQNEEAV